MNDAEALKILFRDYQPVLSEKGYLLLKRHPRGQDLVLGGTTVFSQSIQIGETVEISDLNHEPLLLTLEIRKSLLGHLYALLYRLPKIYLEVETTKNLKRSYRIIPKMTRSGFLINPFIPGRIALMKWYKNKPLQRVTRLRVVIKPDWLQLLFQSTIDIKLNPFEVTPYPINDDIKQRI